MRHALLPSKAVSLQEFNSAAGELKILQAHHAIQLVLISKTEIRAPFAGRVGIRTDGQVQILRCLNAGDAVVTTNRLRIRPGLKVAAEK